jgi:hypothetical protein
MVIYQLLDQRMDGAMRSKGRAMLDRLESTDTNQPVNQGLAAKLAEECWNDLTKDDILDAWDRKGLAAIQTAP